MSADHQQNFSHHKSNSFSESFNIASRSADDRGGSDSADRGLRKVANRLSQIMERDDLVRQTVDDLQTKLNVDRVVLYYFYCKWEGQVTFEALSKLGTSILGSRGPDECFNGEYAAMYEAGRVRAIADIELEPIEACHRDYLRHLEVRANLVVPVLNLKGLWGLLVAHHCQDVRVWSEADITAMQQGAERLSSAPSIKNS